MTKHRKRRGHYCWVCNCHRANEQFSGKGHRRHVCKRCSRLGKREIAFLQGVRHIDQTLDSDGVIRRRRRKCFERFLSNPNPYVRAYAVEVQARDRWLRAELHGAIGADLVNHYLEMEELVERFRVKSREGIAPTSFELSEDDPSTWPDSPELTVGPVYDEPDAGSRIPF